MRQTLKAVSFLLLASVAMPVWAQSAPAGESLEIPEIIVTAQKRKEKLIDVPISITALTADQLQQSARRNVRDLQFAVPNLTTYSQSDFNPNIIIRGFESSARNVGFESSLGVYVDGVFTGRTASFTQELDDVERLEVLRGPQGTLFGKNTTTGAINITTKRPGNDFEGSAKLEGGNFGYYRSGLSLSGPIVADKLAAKVSGFLTGHDGYVTNVSTPNEPAANSDKSYGFRGEIRFTPTEAFDIALRGDYAHRTGIGFENEAAATLENPLDLPVDNIIPGPRTISADRNIENRDIYGGSLTLNYTLGNNGVLTSISALRGLKLGGGGDTDSSPLDIINFATQDRLSQFSQELRYASPGDGAFKYVVGAYYFSQTAKSTREFGLGSVSQAVLGGLLEQKGIPVDVIPSLLTPAAITDTTKANTKSYALFFNGSYNLTEQLSLNAGIRYSSETKKITLAQSSPPVLDFPVLGFYINVPATSDQFKDNDFSPTVGLSYKISEYANTYLRYSKGFKSGGWNAELLTPAVAVFNAAGDLTGYTLKTVNFKPESIANYEFGIKTELLNRKLRVNLAVFQQDYSDIQIGQFIGGVQGYATSNAAKARSRGFELEVNAKPASGFDFNASLGYADSKYRRYLTVDGDAPVDLSGKPLQTPRWTATIGGQYAYPVADSIDVVVGADYAYRSSVPGDPLDTLSGSPGFGLLDARLGVEVSGSWSIYLWGKNILANDYVIQRGTDTTSSLVLLSQFAVNYGDPRTFGVRASYNF
jgi:iron complex outermembrane recepter protein